MVFVTLASAIFLSYKMSYSDKVSMFSLSLSQFIQAPDLSDLSDESEKQTLALISLRYMDQKIYWHPTKLVPIKQKRIQGQRTTEVEASRTSRVKSQKTANVYPC